MEKYELVEKLASGSYGTVFLCQDKTTNEKVAIKMFSSSDQDAQVLKSAVRETLLLQKCQGHSNVIKIHQALRSKSGRIYLVLEYLPSILSHRIKSSGPVPEAECWSILHQLLSATSSLHKQRILHRDLKPSNIGFSPDGTLKLFDFGLARTWARFEKGLSPYVTTRWYRCPELLVGASYGPEVDVWAIGCILAEMAVGKVLFPGTTHMEQLEMVSSCLSLPAHFVALQEELKAMEKASARQDQAKDENKAPLPVKTLKERLEGVSEDMIKVIEACLTVDPLRRPSVDDLLSWPMIKSAGSRKEVKDNSSGNTSANLSPSRSSGSSTCNLAKPEEVIVESFNQDQSQGSEDAAEAPTSPERADAVSQVTSSTKSSSYSSCFCFHPCN